MMRQKERPAYADLHRARRIIATHYGKRAGEITNQMVADELANLRRRDAAGTLDDRYLTLFIALDLDRESRLDAIADARQKARPAQAETLPVKENQ